MEVRQLGLGHTGDCNMKRNGYLWWGVEAEEDGVGRLISYQLRGSGVACSSCSAAAHFRLMRCILTVDTS